MTGQGSYSYTGALAGYIEKSGAGTIKIENCHTLGIAVSGGENATRSRTGGLAGVIAGVTVTSCSNGGPVTGGDTSNSYTGGLIGYSDASSITSSLNSGPVTGGKTGTGTIYTGGLTGYALNTPITNSYNTADIDAKIGRAGGLAGYVYTGGNAVVISNCWSSGSVTGTDATVGGLVGYLNANANTLTLENCLAIPASLTGKTGETRRMAGGKVTTGITLTGNYAYVPAGTRENDAAGLDGADWNGLMTSPPVGGIWDPTVWIIDPTHAVMPKLAGLTGQSDIANPLFGNQITATFDMQGAPGIDPQPVDFGKKITRPSPDPVYNGHTFEGWYADAAGTTLFDFDYVVDAFSNDTVIYAKWKRNTFTVALPAIEGITYDKQHAWQLQVVYGDDFTFTPTVAEGYSPISEVKAGFGHTVIDNGDGSYTIKNVTGDVRIYIYGVTKQYAVTVTLTIEDKELAEHVRFYPGPGTYTVNKGKLFQILAYLDDTCDESDLVLIANGETIIAEEKKTELRSIAYTFKVLITEDMDIQVAGVERNATSLPNPSQGGAKVYTTPGHLHILSAVGSQQSAVSGVRIYALTGQLVDKRPLSEGTTTIPLKKGVYMVVIEDKPVKVIVR